MTVGRLAATALASRTSTGVRQVSLTVATTTPLEFVDLTPTVGALVASLGLVDGVVTLQTRHTTTGLLINELEPLLLEDLAAMFERCAPERSEYAHDDPARRRVNLTEGERRNGHAHCRAALLRASESLAVSDGALDLGRWQRVLFVDFDGGQTRHLSLTLIGSGL